MKAVILAGGEGTRLRPVTGDAPKPMALLAGKPVLEHILLLLKANGIEQVCITLRYRPDVIMDYFGDGGALGVKIEYHVETAPLGTAGAVKACPAKFTGRDFLVISGDCACDFRLSALAEAHFRHGAPLTMALHSEREPLRYGSVLTDTLGKVVAFAEKPRWRQVVSDLVNTGIYIVSPAAMSLVPEGIPFDFAKDLFPRILDAGMEIRGIPMDGYWCDIGTPRDYHRCNLDALDGRLSLPGVSTAKDKEIFADSPPDGSRRLIPCKDRAMYMRLVSRHMMEAGADFSDGIHLRSAEGELHIHPSERENILILDVKAASPDKEKALADSTEELIRNMEKQ